MKKLAAKNGPRIKKQQTKTGRFEWFKHVVSMCQSRAERHGRQLKVNERTTKKTGFNLCEENSSVL